jgi:CTD kinase subunit beta
MVCMKTAAEDRKKVIVIERLILETICFNFTVQMAFSYVIKFGKELGATKDLTKMAWRLTADRCARSVRRVLPNTDSG